MSESHAIVADQNGNYSSPALQTLHGVWSDYDEETVEQDEVLRVVGNVEAYVKSQIEEMEAAAASPGVDVHEPNRVAILDGFYDHLRGLERMRAYFDSEDGALVDEGFDLIQAATNQMVRGFGGLLEESERLSSLKVCPKCSRENEAEAGFCRRCGVVLPVTSVLTEKRLLAVVGDALPSGEASGVETTPNYIEVADALEGWRAGTLGDEGFLQVLDAVRERHLNQHEATLRYCESDVSGEVLLQVEELARALESNVLALEAMASALEDGHGEAVVEGMAGLASATLDLVAAQRVLQAPAEG